MNRNKWPSGSNAEKSPIFSVIIPTFNQALYIERTLASVFSQTFTDFEVLVVDDGSTDDTVSIIERSGYPVRVLNQANLGPGIARNQGVSKAVGRYVAFLDGDDLWFPWTLKTFHDALVENSECRWAIGKCIEFHEDDELKSVVSSQGLGSSLNQPVPDFLATSRDYFEIYTGEFAILRETLNEVGGYEGGLMNLEDGDLYLRLGDGVRISSIKKPVVFAYRRRSGSTSGNLSYAIEACKRVLERESAGTYPGGGARRLERMRIISRYVRPVAIRALREGALPSAWALYLGLLGGNLRLGRVRFLVAFPVLCFFGLLKSALTRSRSCS